jgi:hypothetical protein
MGGRSLGLGNATAVVSDEWSLLNNIGGLSKIKSTSVATAYEARPGLVGANRMAALLVAPTKIGTSGFGFFRFGDDVYNEQIASLGFSNGFGNTSLGININYLQYRAIGYETKSTIGIHFGGLTQLSKIVSIGAYILNVNQPHISAIGKEKLPTHLVIGIGLKPKEPLLLLFEIDKELSYNPTIKVAMEYQPHKKVIGRMGFNLQPQAAFFGIGFIHSQMKLDYAFQYTQNLNYAFQMSLTYPLKKPRIK